jgi:hypothetical protein
VAKLDIAPAGLPSALAEAIDDVCREMERYHARWERRQRLTRCVNAADELIGDLQDLALAGRPVPAAWQARLDRFLGQLPPEVRLELHVPAEPVGLLDRVVEIEERLFRLKLGEWALVFRAGRSEPA